MTLNQKRIAAMLIIVFVLALLTGCGKSTPAVSDDPNIGIWKATKVEMFGDESDADEVFDGGFEIELKAGGKCELRAESKKDSYAWAIQGNTLTISASSADFISATIKDSVMVIGDFMGTGMKITLEKEGAVTSKPASSNAPAALDVGYYVIDSMTIDGERYDAESLKSMGIRYYIRLNEDNTAQISTDTLIKGTWKDGEIHYQQEGEDVINEYVLEGDTLTIEILDGSSEATLVFKRGSEPEPESAAQALWNGSWYGYMWVTESVGYYASDEDFYNDAYLSIDIDETGAGTLEMSLDGHDESALEAYIYADENHFEVIEGFFLGMRLDPDIWWVALSPVDEGNLLVISDTYIDPEKTGGSGFECIFVFRPLGELWEQEEREGDRLPPGYDLYKEEQSRGGSTAVSDTSGGTPEGEFDVQPHFTSAELRKISEEISKAYNDFTLKDLTYEQVCDKYFNGVDGMLDYEEGVLAIYKCSASNNGEVYVQVSFQDYNGDGNKTAGGVGSYFP